MVNIDVSLDHQQWLEYMDKRIGMFVDPSGKMGKALTTAQKEIRKETEASVMDYYTVAQGTYDSSTEKKDTRRGFNAESTWTSARGLTLRRFTTAGVWPGYGNGQPMYTTATVIRGSGGGMVVGSNGFKGFWTGVNSGTQLMARTTKSRYPLEMLYGPSTASMTRRRFEDDSKIDAQAVLWEKMNEAAQQILNG